MRGDCYLPIILYNKKERNPKNKTKHEKCVSVLIFWRVYCILLHWILTMTCLKSHVMCSKSFQSVLKNKPWLKGTQCGWIINHITALILSDLFTVVMSSWTVHASTKKTGHHAKSDCVFFLLAGWLPEGFDDLITFVSFWVYFLFNIYLWKAWNVGSLGLVFFLSLHYFHSPHSYNKY